LFVSLSLFVFVFLVFSFKNVIIGVQDPISLNAVDIDFLFVEVFLSEIVLIILRMDVLRSANNLIRIALIRFRKIEVAEKTRLLLWPSRSSGVRGSTLGDLEVLEGRHFE
ncbi:hypothetical protein BKA66DRAFT_600144, partial [Pyrenochaeta sp. MPI-SDFR-AT-0127]